MRAPGPGPLLTAAGELVVTLGQFGLRRLGVRWLQPSPVLGLARAERKAAARALRPGGTVTPEHRASAVALARDVLRYRWAPCSFVVIGLGDGGLAATVTGAMRWVHAACCLIGLALAGYHLLTLRRAPDIEAREAEARGPGDGAEAAS